MHCCKQSCSIQGNQTYKNYPFLTRTHLRFLSQEPPGIPLLTDPIPFSAELLPCLLLHLPHPGRQHSWLHHQIQHGQTIHHCHLLPLHWQGAPLTLLSHGWLWMLTHLMSYPRPCSLGHFPLGHSQLVCWFLCLWVEPVTLQKLLLNSCLTITAPYGVHLPQFWAFPGKWNPHHTVPLLSLLSCCLCLYLLVHLEKHTERWENSILPWTQSSKLCPVAAALRIVWLAASLGKRPFNPLRVCFSQDSSILFHYITTTNTTLSLILPISHSINYPTHTPPSRWGPHTPFVSLLQTYSIVPNSPIPSSRIGYVGKAPHSLCTSKLLSTWHSTTTLPLPSTSTAFPYATKYHPPCWMTWNHWAVPNPIHTHLLAWIVYICLFGSFLLMTMSLHNSRFQSPPMFIL